MVITELLAQSCIIIIVSVAVLVESFGSFGSGIT